MELKIARKLARLTQKQLADLAGVDDSTISVVESGRRDIRSMSYASVVRIAQVLGVDATELWPVPPLAEAVDDTTKRTV
jgi:transcriptional regulator with XRE-family HTH domain